MANFLSMRCPSCHKAIKSQGEALHALRETWHKDCFRCFVCNVRLHQVFFSRKKKLYCKQHYLAKYNCSCHKCHKKITGIVQVAGDVSFHPECFRCMKCRAIIGNGDDYVFEERSRLFCCRCHDNDVANYKGFKLFKLFQHNAIHQVAIAPSEIKEKLFSVKVKDREVQKQNTRSYKKRAASVVSIVSSKTDDSSHLKTGDTLLEINGVPVTGNNINQFSDLLHVSDDTKRISFTIERNPDEDKETTSTEIPVSKTIPRTPITADPEKYKRNEQFFNFSVPDRSLSESSAVKRKPFNRRKAAVNDFHFLPEDDQKKILRIVSQPQGIDSISQKKTSVLLQPRSKSMNDIQSMTVDEENRMYIKNDTLKTLSPLHRAQTLKPDALRSCNSHQVFRPVDLVCGEVVGVGAFGDVVKITHNSSGKDMVMKRLRQVDTEAEEQFLKEVQLLKSLQHPNVLQFIGVMYQDKVLHIIVEYIAGGTLRGLLKNKHIELPWRQRLELGKDIACGMTYLHRQNVMHRDLKSKNVLIQSSQKRRTAIVADFGLASVMQETTLVVNLDESPSPRKSSLSTRPTFKKRHTVVGSPYWMAPEMLKGQAYNETVDVFSFGIVLCEIIGRVKADPEVLPRTKDFGLDVEKFTLKFGESCPEYFLLLASTCSDMNPEKRPPFQCCEKWLQSILANLEFNIPLPEKKDLNFCEEPEPLCLNNASCKIHPSDQHS